MTPKRRMVVATGAVAAVIGLAACSPSSGSGDAGSDHANAAKVGSGAYNVAGSAPSLEPQAAAGSAGSARSADAAGPAAEGSGGGVGRPTTTSVVLPGSSVIRTAQLSVDVAHARDVAGLADRADVIAESVGGEIDSDNRTSGKHAQADLVLRVPPDSLSSVLTRLSELGKERSRELSTTDVTERVADVSSRVASAQATISRLRTIYASATKISDVLAIEDDLSSREADLEALQAQQRALARKTSMATITMSLRTASQTAPPLKTHDRGGFLGGLDRGWHAFTSAAAASATGLGAALPFLVLVLVLGLLGRLGWSRLPARGSPIAPAAPPSGGE